MTTLTPEQKNIIKEITVLKDTDLECSICLDKFEKNDRTKVLPCGHMFCSKCLDDWFEKQINCPECRDKIDPEKEYSKLDKKISKLIKKYNKYLDHDRELPNEDYKLEICVNSNFIIERTDDIKFIGFDKCNNVIFSSQYERLRNINNKVLCIANISYIHHLILYLSTLNKSYRINLPIDFAYNAKHNRTRINIDIKLMALINLAFYIEYKFIQYMIDGTDIRRILKQYQYDVCPKNVYGERTKWIEYKDGYYEWYPKSNYYDYYDYYDSSYYDPCCTIL